MSGLRPDIRDRLSASSGAPGVLKNGGGTTGATGALLPGTI